MFSHEIPLIGCQTKPGPVFTRKIKKAENSIFLYILWSKKTIRKSLTKAVGVLIEYWRMLNCKNVIIVCFVKD